MNEFTVKLDATIASSGVLKILKMKILMIIIFLEINSRESPVVTAMETEDTAEAEGLQQHHLAASVDANGV